MDLPYIEIARYAGDRVAAALADADITELPQLERVGEAARRWAKQESDFVQRWVEVIALTRSGPLPSSRQCPPSGN